jgi:large subunit ribosomal protein L29
MKAEKMREWTADEMRAKEREFSDQLFRLKFQLASGQSDVLQKIRVLRRDIARVKTLLRQNEMQAAEGAEKKS